MKKLLFFLTGLCIYSLAYAQQKPVVLSGRMQNLMIPKPASPDDPGRFGQTVNNAVNARAVLEEMIGGSEVYDQQTNSSMPGRLYLWPDGAVSATWMKSDLTGNADRGTGYNYSNGTTWGPLPSSRLESVKAGWPTINRWMGNGELVISHRTTANLVMNTRPVRGTGGWTETMAPVSPSSNAIVWPAAITSGNNFQNIHLLAMTRTLANGGSLYKGLNGALLYYRSLDGGATWDKQGIQFPGLDSTHYLGFAGDDYAWIEPHGDTIAFLCGGNWVDTFLMRSYDNGSTWSKIPILPNYYCKSPENQITPRFICSDGSFAGVMDKNGVFHVAFGRMRALDDGTGHKYAPGTDGLVYWNSTMPVLDTAIVTDLDSLISHGLCIGYVASDEAGDTIVGFPSYGVSLSSFPQMTVDKYNNIYCLWSGLTVGNPSPDSYNYRHIWGSALFSGKTAWSQMQDFNADVLYIFQEYVYPAIAKGIKNNNIQLITQTSSQPGSSVKDPAIPVHPVLIDYREVPTSAFIPAGNNAERDQTGIVVSGSFPNPASDKTFFLVSLDKPSTVQFEVTNLMGQLYISAGKGMVQPGKQRYQIDCSLLPRGVYICKVTVSGKTFTHKLVVE
ncbi:MAG: T9SS type A sorting domain-containing protein [Bacteroidota bacterium]